MITHIRIQNYRSFVDAEVALRPFTLVVGANGSGKSNLLGFFSTVSQKLDEHRSQSASGVVQTNFLIPRLDKGVYKWMKHQNYHDSEVGFKLEFSDRRPFFPQPGVVPGRHHVTEPLSWQGEIPPVFNIDPSKVSAVEPAVPDAKVKGDGSGTAQVLDVLKNGDREDLFDQIEENFRRYVPEVEKLSLRTVEQGKKQIQVREKGLKDPLPATELSEGTRLILAILTILHQEKPPPVILLEDIDRGLHPRLFEFVAPLMRDIAKRKQVNILASTHNPYLVDCFQDDKEAVVIVEKENGASSLSTLASRLEGLDYEKVDPEDMPLGNLWFTGLVGGTPLKLTKRPQL